MDFFYLKYSEMSPGNVSSLAHFVGFFFNFVNYGISDFFKI